MIEFQECDVIINGVGISSNSASISQTNNLSPDKIINSSFNKLIPVGGISNNIQINYKIPLEQDPNLQIIENLKTYPQNLNCVLIEVAGIECSGYLTNYSFSLKPNSLIEASVSYISFFNSVGEISPKRGVIEYKLSNDELAHSWGSSISYGETGFIKTYSLDYDISFNYDPVYIINSIYPKQVILAEGNEKITIIKDKYLNISFYGEENLNNLISGGYIYIRKIDNEGEPIMTFNLTNYKIVSSNLNSLVNNYPITEISLNKAF